MSGNPKEIAGSPNSMSINTDRLGGALKAPGMQRIHGVLLEYLRYLFILNQA